MGGRKYSYSSAVTQLANAYISDIAQSKSLPAVMMHHGDHVMTPHNPTAHISSGDFDTALAIARLTSIDASQIQIKPPSDVNNGLFQKFNGAGQLRQTVLRLMCNSIRS